MIKGNFVCIQGSGALSAVLGTGCIISAVVGVLFVVSSWLQIQRLESLLEKRSTEWSAFYQWNQANENDTMTSSAFSLVLALAYFCTALVPLTIASRAFVFLLQVRRLVEVKYTSFVLHRLKERRTIPHFFRIRIRVCAIDSGKLFRQTANCFGISAYMRCFYYL